MARRPIDYQALRDQVDVERVLSVLGWRTGAREPAGYRGPCPLHEPCPRRSRSLSVGRYRWYCHRCRVGGDALELWYRVRGGSRLDAAYQMCDALGIAPPILAR